MKLTVLLDNNTTIDRYFLGEPGVSYYIQDGEVNILFDAGYSDAFIINSDKMGKNLVDIDYIIISHGHNDHTWGLSHLIKKYSESNNEIKNNKKPKLLSHPLAFNDKYSDNEHIGSLISLNKAKKYFDILQSKNPIWITEKIVFLGEIERRNNFENKTAIGKTLYLDQEIDDYVMDDTALVYKSSEGLVIITGCSHSGICNIIDYAKKICNDERIVDIIGGFHLLSPEEAILKMTLEFFKENNIKRIHACHCTDLKSKIALSEVCEVKEVGVGLTMEY